MKTKNDPIVLLAEDNGISREVAKRLLARLGYLCESADDGEAAWDMLQRHYGRYDLLLTDGQMPRLDGYRLVERIRKFEAETGSPRLKIVMLTASILAADQERCLALDVDGFLNKPLLAAPLEEKLSELSEVPVVPHLEEQQARSGADLHAGFIPLMNLLHGNQSAFNRIIDEFVRATRADILSLDEAVQDGDRGRIGQLAHNIKSACFQLGQRAAGDALAQLERAAAYHPANSASFDLLVHTAKQELMRSLILAENYLLDNQSRHLPSVDADS